MRKVQKEMNLRLALSTIPRLFLGKASKGYMKGMCYTYGAKVKSLNIRIRLESGQEPASEAWAPQRKCRWPILNDVIG